METPVVKLQSRRATHIDSYEPRSEEVMPRETLDLMDSLFERFMDMFLSTPPSSGGKSAPNDAARVITASLLRFDAWMEGSVGAAELLQNLQRMFNDAKADDVFKNMVEVIVHCGVENEIFIKNGVKAAPVVAADVQEKELEIERKVKKEKEEKTDEVTATPTKAKTRIKREIKKKQVDSEYEADEEEEGEEEEEEEEEDEDYDAEWNSSSKKRKRNTPTTKRPNKRSKKDSDSAPSKKMKGKKKGKKNGKQVRSSPDKWTPEEDARLTLLVQKYGTTRKWTTIAKELDSSKDAAKCAQHWRRVLDPAINRDQWSADEEKTLLRLVKRYGDSAWKKIAGHLEGRADTKCRDRYRKLLRGQARKWTPKEDKALKEIVTKINKDKINWIKVSNNFQASLGSKNGRTPLECKRRWKIKK